MNFGWALTQNPKFIPIDGSTITVWSMASSVGNADYNHFRPDIAAAVPRARQQQWRRRLQNPRHDDAHQRHAHVSWTVRDSGNNVEGIGSRYFTVTNGAAAVDRRGDLGREPSDGRR